MPTKSDTPIREIRSPKIQDVLAKYLRKLDCFLKAIIFLSTLDLSSKLQQILNIFHMDYYLKY
jgi:hypothetical protein